MTKRGKKRHVGGQGGEASRADRAKAAETRKRIAQYVRDRDEALMSLDRATFLAFVLKWQSMTTVNPAMLDSEALTLVCIHKMRTAATSLPLEARRVSKAWLVEHHLKSMDGGELG